jgi:hypothetical protein
VESFGAVRPRFADYYCVDMEMMIIMTQNPRTMSERKLQAAES